MRRIALVSAKGGVGKSTCTINVAASLARAGSKTLIVDLDPQANVSLVALKGEPPAAPTAYEVIMGESPADAAVVSFGENLFLVPATPGLAEANVGLVNELGRERRLRLALDDLEDRFDVALIDTSPSTSLLTVNALNGVDEVLVPVAPSLFSLAGLGQIQTSIDEVRRYLDNRALKLGGIILTMVERTAVARDVETQVRDTFPGLVFDTVIHRAVKVEEAHSRFMSVIDYAPRSSGAAEFLALTEEILAHGKREEVGTRRGPRRPDSTHDAAA